MFAMLTETDIETARPWLYTRAADRGVKCDDIDDVVQTTCLKAWKYRANYDRGRSKPITWITKILDNVIRDYMMDSGKKELELLTDSRADVLGDEPEPLEGITGSPPELVTLAMRMDGHTPREIAWLTGITVRRQTYARLACGRRHYPEAR